MNWLKKNISKAQFGKKAQYDKSASKVKITEGNLVMLKIKPRFKLDCTFRWLYRVIGVTSTCATIVPISTSDGKVINVSLQRLSICKGENLGADHPWVGTWQNRRNKQPQEYHELQNSETSSRV